MAGLCATGEAWTASAGSSPTRTPPSLRPRPPRPACSGKGRGRAILEGMTSAGGPGASGPIVIFAAGVARLSVARPIRAALPAEDILSVADTAYCPYGDRPLEEV